MTVADLDNFWSYFIMSNNTENIVLNQLVTEEKIPVSIYQNIKSPQGKQFEITWEKFCEKLNKPMVSDTKDVMLFSPTRLNATKLRANANVVVTCTQFLVSC